MSLLDAAYQHVERGDYGVALGAAVQDAAAQPFARQGRDVGRQKPVNVAFNFPLGAQARNGGEGQPIDRVQWQHHASCKLVQQGALDVQQVRHFALAGRQAGVDVVLRHSGLPVQSASRQASFQSPFSSTCRLYPSIASWLSASHCASRRLFTWLASATSSTCETLTLSCLAWRSKSLFTLRLTGFFAAVYS